MDRSGAAGQRDDIPGLHRLAHLGQQLGVVAVQSGETVAVVDHDVVAVAALVISGHRHRPRQRRPDGRAGGHRQIHAGVAFPLACKGVDPVAELRGDHRLPARPDGGAEAVRADEGHSSAGKPAAACPGGGPIDHQIVDAVGVGPVFLRDLHAQRRGNPLVDFIEVLDGMGHPNGLGGLHLIALLIYGCDRPGLLRPGHEAVHKGLESGLVRLLSAEIQGKNGLDPVPIKGRLLFHLFIDFIRKAVQYVKARPRLVHRLPILR